MKKFLSLFLIAAMLLGMTVLLGSCSDNSVKAGFKLGVILLHDEDSTYDKNFINGVNDAKKQLKLKDSQVIIKRNIGESNACFEAAEELIDDGCDLIFADSFGHETHMIAAAKKHPDIQFCHATGVQAHKVKLANYHNAFASIYEGRFLAGVAAGLKLNEMIDAGKFAAKDAKIGYVGAFTYAEVISGYTSFFLGARSVCPTATMDVQFTGSWYDETAEKNTANSLINGGCKLISQHADSMGAPAICEEKGVPNVSYNGSTKAHCPNTFIVSSRINWTPYIKYICQCVIDGQKIDTDWCGTLKTDSVILSDVNEQAAAPGTVAKLAQIRNDLVNGVCHVFDTAKFTVGDQPVTTHLVDDIEVVENGIFEESKVQSAPYFDLRIDGIKLLNENYG